MFERDTADAWYELPTSAFVPDGTTCGKCGGSNFERERDILDVWFDSGSSHEAVLAKRPDLTWPADMYLEGTDQYRGWFQSSLLVGVGTRDKAPYRSVLTHGFVVDEQGRKMSKSIGNVVSPQQLIKDSGSEVLRLLVAMVDARDEVRLGKEVLARTVEAYRKIRNTVRYLLSNLYDFQPSDAVPVARMPEVDRFALSQYARLARRVLDAYDAYDFQAVFQAVNEYVTVDLSAFYLDVSKDRLYTLRADSSERRSAQTVLFTIADGLTRLIAPILSVTADEIWALLPGDREPSAHMADFPARTDDLRDESLDARWATLLEVRRAVQGALEMARADKAIGAPLTAQVTVSADPEVYAVLSRPEVDLAMLFITSAARVTLNERTSGDEAASPGGATLEVKTLDVGVTHAAGDKCPRCWRFVTDAMTSGDFAGLCPRCADALGDGHAAV